MAALRPRDSTFLGEAPPAALSPAITDDDHAYYVASFTESGFRGPLNWYRNMAAIPTLAPWLKDARIQIPAFFLAGSDDPVLQFGMTFEGHTQLLHHRRLLVLSGSSFR